MASVSTNNLQQQTCLSVYTFLGKAHNTATSAFSSGPNLTSFSTELAIGIRTLLFDHFKKFPVNPAGCLMVTKDITKYTELLSSWPLQENFRSTLEVLAEIGNLFVVGPEALRERVRGGGFSGVERGDLRAYILRREDAGSVGVQSVLNSL
jgi:exocyst complex component 5